MRPKRNSLLFSVALLLATSSVAATTSTVPTPVCAISCLADPDTDIFNCSNCQCTKIPKTPDDSTWSTILLSNNSIANVFPLDSTFPRAEILDFSDNDIDTIEDDAFKGLTSLKVLNFFNNNLGSFDLRLLEPLAYLQELSLKSNYIDKFTGEVDLLNLLRLDLSENNIGELNQALQGFSYLQFLNLSNNQLEAIDRQDFEHLDSLVELYLVDNHISSIARSAFVACNRLKVLDLRYNYIEVLVGDHFDGLISLETLDLSFNRLTTIDTSAFVPLSSLTTLTIEKNPLETFTSANGVSMPTTLQSLAIVSTSLTVIENGTLGGLCYLSNLTIANNSLLTLFEPGAFSGCTSWAVNYLDISNNALVWLDNDLFFWDSLVSVNASGNRWICNCTTTWMKNITASGDTFSCYNPEYLRGMKLATIPQQRLACNFWNGMRNRVGRKLGIWLIMIATLTFVTMLSYLIYKNRRRLLPSAFRNSDKYATLFNAADMDESTITLHRTDELNKQRNNDSPSKPQDV